MGGWGSGHYYRWQHSDRRLASSYRRLDVRQIHREGWLEPGAGPRSLVWRSTRTGKEVASISYTVSGDDRAEWMLLSYSVNGEPVKRSIELEWTPCTYGGSRVWIRCPRCDRRVAVLYGGRLFLCRHCHDLAYDSTREDAPSRGIGKAQAIRRRLGGSANMMEPFPDKPKGMHWRTYDRLFYEAHEAYVGAMTGMLERLESATRKLSG